MLAYYIKCRRRGSRLITLSFHASTTLKKTEYNLKIFIGEYSNRIVLLYSGVKLQQVDKKKLQTMTKPQFYQFSGNQ